jgi:hypothetical protein
VNRFLKSALSGTIIVLAFTAAAKDAGAQQFFSRRQGSVVFVTPNGEILDYMPEGSGYARDRSGNRVLSTATATSSPPKRAHAATTRRRRLREVYNNDPYYSDDSTAIRATPNAAP